MSTEFSESLAPWLAERAEANRTAWVVKQAKKRADRAAFKAARDAGLKKRHARKRQRALPNPFAA